MTQKARTPGINLEAVDPFQPLSDRMILIVAFSVGLLICLMSAFANAFLLSVGTPFSRMLMKYNVAGSVVAILLVWRLLRWARERNELARERMRIVFELNHQIRNAVQAIALTDYCQSGTDDTVIKKSVVRIERALDSCVPSTTAKEYLRKHSRHTASAGNS